jgi:hypothetical protein
VGHSAAQFAPVKRLLSLILLLGALLGLFGQAAAFAMSPPFTPATEATAVQSMPMDCAEMPQKEPEQTPCKGLTLDCIAAMGCTLPTLLAEAGPLDLANDEGAPIERSISTPVLTGRSIAPEPYPPTLLI